MVSGCHRIAAGLPLPFAVCARFVRQIRVSPRLMGSAFGLLHPSSSCLFVSLHEHLNEPDLTERRTHRSCCVGVFRLMNAGDRRGPLGSHSFILGHTPRLTTSYCAVSGSPARSFKQLAPSTLAIAIGAKRRFTLSPGVRNTTCFLHFRSTYRPDIRHSRSTFAVRPDVTSPPSAPPPL